MKLRSGRAANESARPVWRPIPAWQWTLAAVAAVVIVAFVVTMWLLAIANGAKPGTDRANSRLDAVRTGLAAGAGAGAAVGLMLAFRRQHHQEIATVLTDLDATERRITELYTKAVEQLGNETAPVRLGGLYALERLAQDNPAHRQTIVNVICAYLRMPFSAEAPTGSPGDAWQQERQVRLTAQRVLIEHLRNDTAGDQRSTEPSSPRFWPDISLDLVGATLINFDFQNGVTAAADFTGAAFRGDTQFAGVTFGNDVTFNDATFSSGAWFGGATFSGYARFLRVTFSRGAWFVGSAFSGGAVFLGTTFGNDVLFNDATFSGDAYFPKATFTNGAWFTRAVFSGGAEFDGGTFSGLANFDGATFNGDAGSLSFKESRVLSPDAKHSWQTGWGLEPDGNGGYTVVREEDAGRS